MCSADKGDREPGGSGRLVSLVSWYGIKVRRQSERARQQELRQRHEENRTKRRQEWKRQQERIISKPELFGARAEWGGNDVTSLRSFYECSSTDDDLGDVFGLDRVRAEGKWAIPRESSGGNPGLRRSRLR